MRADAQRKRQMIIDAATETFRTVPDAHITLEGIARDAGVGIATLYRHFPTRRDLRLACAQNLLDSLDGALAQAVEVFDDDPGQHWESLVWRMVDEGTGMLVAALSEQRSGEFDSRLLAMLDRVMTRLDVLLGKAARHGLVDPELSASEFAAEVIVVTRPQNRTLNELFPDVQARLVRHLLVAWKQPGSG